MSFALVRGRRYLSFSSIIDKFRSRGNVAVQTGGASGTAFLEPPVFNVVGNPGTLLDIKLPASAVLNLRTSRKTSIVGMNGEVEDLTKDIAMIRSNLKPIVYQRILNSSPVSLLVSSQLHQQSFIVLDLKQQDQWNINETNLVAWYESNILPRFSDRLLDSFNTIEASGQGIVTLSGQGNIFKVEVKEGESMLVNPKNLVLYNTREISLQKLETKYVNLKIPAFNSLEILKVWYARSVSSVQKLLKMPTSNLNSEPNKYVQRITNYMNKRAENKTNDKLFKVQGPITLILQNNV